MGSVDIKLTHTHIYIYMVTPHNPQREANLSEQQLATTLCLHANMLERLEMIRKQQYTSAGNPADESQPHIAPTLHFDDKLSEHVNDFHNAINSAGVTMLLLLEQEWLMFSEVLPPLLVAKLWLCLFPGVIDLFMIQYVIAQIAGERGMLSSAEVQRQQQYCQKLYSIGKHSVTSQFSMHVLNQQLGQD